MITLSFKKKNHQYHLLGNDAIDPKRESSK